jgi:hypothetical protein
LSAPPQKSQQRRPHSHQLSSAFPYITANITPNTKQPPLRPPPLPGIPRNVFPFVGTHSFPRRTNWGRQFPGGSKRCSEISSSKSAPAFLPEPNLTTTQPAVTPAPLCVFGHTFRTRLRRGAQQPEGSERCRQWLPAPRHLLAKRPLPY